MSHNRCSKLRSRAYHKKGQLEGQIQYPGTPALIRGYGDIDQEPTQYKSKSGVGKWNNGFYKARPVKYAQEVYYPGLFLNECPKKKFSLIKYDHEPENKDNDEMDVIVPKQDILDDFVAPTISKIVPIKQTYVFLEMQNERLTHQLSLSQLQSSQQQQQQQQQQQPRYSYTFSQSQQQQQEQKDGDDDDDDGDDVNMQQFPSPNIDQSSSTSFSQSQQQQQDGDDTDMDDKSVHSNQNKFHDHQKKYHYIESSSDSDDGHDLINRNSQSAGNIANITNKNNNNDNNDKKQDALCKNQNDKFLNKSFRKPYISRRNRMSAQRKMNQTKHKALISCKPNHRTQISFSTKANFCTLVEHGMTMRDAWRSLKDSGFQVGKSHTNCHRWFTKGSAGWLELIAKHGDQHKFSFLVYTFIQIYI